MLANCVLAPIDASYARLRIELHWFGGRYELNACPSIRRRNGTGTFCSEHCQQNEPVPDGFQGRKPHETLSAQPTSVVFFGGAQRRRSSSAPEAGEPIVPGTGELLKDCCDDFEDADWSYQYNFPKSSHEQDENQRSPGGFSNNGLWHEGGKRGTPDVVKRIATPPGGIEGSMGALLIATKNSGVPGTYSNQQQQDDLLMMFNKRLGRSIPMAWQPSCTVRVYLPPWEDWEKRNGPSFGMRCDCMGREPDGSIGSLLAGHVHFAEPAQS